MEEQRPSVVKQNGNEVLCPDCGGMWTWFIACDVRDTGSGVDLRFLCEDCGSKFLYEVITCNSASSRHMMPVQINRFNWYNWKPGDRKVHAKSKQRKAMDAERGVSSRGGR